MLKEEGEDNFFNNANIYYLLTDNQVLNLIFLFMAFRHLRFRPELGR